MEEAYRHCEALVREADRDRYLAALFVPEATRKHLFALYAFNVEISLVGDRARDALAGEARLQWWREVAVEGGAADIGTSPVASALVDTIRRFQFDKELIENVIKARMFDLTNTPFPKLATLEGYLIDSTAPLFSLASQILGANNFEAVSASEQAGMAYGLTQLLRNFPFHASRGKTFLPLDVLEENRVELDSLFRGTITSEIAAALAEVRQAIRERLAMAEEYRDALRPELTFAFLPLALVRPFLEVMERSDYDPFKTAVEISQVKRQAILWNAARKIG